MRRYSIIIAVIFSCLISGISQLSAQITTSGLNGKISSEGSFVIGATVTAVHQPSGTVYRTVSNGDGRYNIQGMRVGGPYQITVHYIGSKTREVENVYLSLGESFSLDINMRQDAQQLGEVLVVGRSAPGFSNAKTGASTHISSFQILNMPTASRSVSDIVRLSPYANGMGFSGGDGRSTNFRLDGANLNNNFGLNSMLPGGGNPISLEAIDEMQVVIAPYDVRQTNFIGGGINAVTKSGTNTFRGTAYLYYDNENMHGNRVNDTDLGERGTNRNTTCGFTLGGPILKDRLFFFTNFEHSYIPTVINRWQGSEDGIASSQKYLSRTTLSDLQKVSAYVKEKYGYDTGSYTEFPGDENNTKFLARLDWNITDSHHLALRYNYTGNKSWNIPAEYSSDAYTKFSYSRLSEYSMSFANSAYSWENKVSSVSADLNSRFGNHISNQLIFTYTSIQDKRGSDSSEFPFIDILNGYTTAADGTVTQTIEPYMSLGYELFTYNNKVENKVTTVNDNFTYFMGNHKLSAGLNYEHQTALNSYMRNGTGYYRYRSLDDFLSGAAPETVALTYGYNGDTSPSSKVGFNQYGLYLQDEWDALDNLRVTGGIRFDNISFDNDDAVRNNAIYDLDFGGRHIDTGKWPDTNIQVSPRLGFTWDVFGDHRLKVRGGTGLFAGRLPLVFFTNMPSNSGMYQNSVIASTVYKNGVVTSSDSRLQNFAGSLVTDVDKIRQLLGAPSTITSEAGTVPSAIVGIDPDFKMPQVWKSSIAVDYQLPVSFPFTVTGEYTYIAKLNDVMLTNYNIRPIDDTWTTLKGADNRYVYPSDYKYYNKVGNTSLYSACVLTNTHKGYGWTASVSLNAEPLKDLRLMAAYTHTVMKEVSGMPGSNANAAWGGLFTVNGPNFTGVQNSAYVIPDRIVASASYQYRHDHFSLFYTGYNYSSYYTFYYDGDINGDGIKYDLMYIPRNDDEIHFTDESDRALFWNFLRQDSYLSSHQGEYAQANSVKAPFVHRFDFRWAHDFTLSVGGTRHTLSLSADIMNVGNLFNSSWGVEKNMSPCFNGQILKVDKIVDGVPYFTLKKNSDGTAPTKTWDYNYNYDQCWKLQIGIKYYFN